jgi:hypothetical protein
VIFPTILFTETWADEALVGILVENKLARINNENKPILTTYGVDFFTNNGHLNRQEFKDLIRSMDNKNGKK